MYGYHTQDGKGVSVKVYFIGAGPGDPELITLRGRRLIEEAEIVMYAGSLVNPKLLDWALPEAEIYDTSSMDLDAICAVFKKGADHNGSIARLHTGDPSLYGAIGEQICFCRAEQIPWELVPGVSSFSASAAALGRELTLPGISQTVILSRRQGRTPVPEAQRLRALARSQSTLVLFLSASMVKEAMEEIAPFYGTDTPAAAVYRASWPDQRIIEGTISTLAGLMQKAGIDRQAIILVGDVLNPGTFEASKLYDANFSHGFRSSRENAGGGA